MAVKQVEYNGELFTIEQLHAISGMPADVIRYRLRNGYSVEDAIAEVAIKKSIRVFIDENDWHDWVNKSTDDVYHQYCNWCQKHDYQSESKTHFMRQLLGIIPWLVSTPNKTRDGKSIRVLRLVKYDDANTM